MPSPAVTVTVTATDSGQPPLGLQQIFTLPVTDVDLSDLQLPSIVISSSRVAEDAVAGTEVGALYDLNHTISDTVHFTLLKDKQNLFEVNGGLLGFLCVGRVGSGRGSLLLKQKSFAWSSRQCCSLSFSLVHSRSLADCLNI